MTSWRELFNKKVKIVYDDFGKPSVRIGHISGVNDTHITMSSEDGREELILIESIRRVEKL